MTSVNCEYIIYLLVLCLVGLSQISGNLSSIPKLIEWIEFQDLEGKPRDTSCVYESRPCIKDQ